MASWASSASTRFSSLRAAAARRSRHLAGHLLELGGQRLLLCAQLLPCVRRRAPPKRSGGARLSEESQDLGNRLAVFALQPVDRRQPRFDFLQPPGVGLQTARGNRAARRRPPAGSDRRPSGARARLRARNRCGTAPPPVWLPVRASETADSGPNRRARRKPSPAASCSRCTFCSTRRSFSSAASSLGVRARRFRFPCAGTTRGRAAAASPVRSAPAPPVPPPPRARRRIRAVRSSSGPRCRRRHPACRAAASLAEQKLLIVLAVDVGQVRRQVPQQRGGHRTAAHEGPRLAAGQDLPLDQQFAVFDFQARPARAAAGRRRLAHIENAGHARPRCARCGPCRRRRARPAAGPSASTTMDLPLPVSPVSRFSPA